MKIIITESQYDFLSEMIKLDIKVGDTIMGGKFKNKKVVVKSIGKNDKGDITINGKPLLRFRIINESTVTEAFIYWKLPKKYVEELGIELYNKDDMAFAVEVHFDTRNIFIELCTRADGEVLTYEEAYNVIPSNFKGTYLVSIDSLSNDFKRSLLRRLKEQDLNYL